MLGRPEPPMRKAPNRLPDDIDAAVRKNGLETDGFIRVVESDMDFDGCYLTAWTALDDKGIYFILGDEKVTKKRGNKKIKSEYELREIRSYPLSDFDSLKCEQYVSTGRLIAEKDGDDIGLIKFSLNFLGGYDEFCKAFNSLKTDDVKSRAEEYARSAKDRIRPGAVPARNVIKTARPSNACFLFSAAISSRWRLLSQLYL